MTIEIRVPTLGESVTEATIGKWFKKAGEAVKADEPLVELETDKVTVEVPAPASGVMGEIFVAQGTTVAVGALLASLKDGAGQPAAAAMPTAAVAAMPTAAVAAMSQATTALAAAKPAPPAAPTVLISDVPPAAPRSSAPTAMPPSPAARKAIAEAGLDPTDVSGTGRRGQVLKSDIAGVKTNGVAATASPPAPADARPAPAVPLQPVVSTQAPVLKPAPALTSAPTAVALRDVRLPAAGNDVNREERVKMSRLRQTIARRLKDAQNTAAMLTTFNDVDMSAVMALRAQYKDIFEKRHGVKLGFMGLFVKACIRALRDIPAINAEIDGDEIVYKNYYHIGVAVGTEKGLVVPVVRDAERLSLAEIEQKITEFGRRARDGKLSIEDMQGGTFTISNGGVYGSMMSTPILNAPQSGILGMHRIEDRPVVRGGQVVVRPMMYLALSYDHRVVDGKEAVTFLVRVKECLEDPQRFILEL